MHCQKQPPQSNHIHQWRGLFAGRLARENTTEAVTVIDPEASAKLVKVLQFINAYRFRGHLEAKLDPINYYRWKVSSVPELDYRYHGFTEQDLNETFNINHYVLSSR